MISIRVETRLLAGALAAVVAALVLVTCRGGPPPREGWSGDWGPVVPHENFPGDCGLCHVPERWDVLRDDFAFDHAAETGHALEGAHARAACLRCHNDFGPVAVYVARGCAGCHADVHLQQLGDDCAQCHDQESWRPGGLVAEHARTRFPLYGAHAAVACERCHERAPTGDYRDAPVDCELCHVGDLARATSPDHSAQGWTAACDRCHRPTTWSGGGFSHAFFPLDGAHAGLDCAACHPGGDFDGPTADCFSCHEDDYRGEDSHVQGDFPTTCQACHSTSSWDGARFDHGFFPLSGGHAGLSCERCHPGGRFSGTPQDCAACHLDDYQAQPIHVTNGFPTDCAQCHTVSGWEGAIFRHTFPLQGDHAVSCATCHTGGDTRQFTCLVCHGAGETNEDHSEVSGYRYDSGACFRCHPGGED